MTTTPITTRSSSNVNPARATRKGECRMTGEEGRTNERTPEFLPCPPFPVRRFGINSSCVIRDSSFPPPADERSRLLLQPGDDADQRHEERDHDRSDDQGEENDHDRLQQ